MALLVILVWLLIGSISWAFIILDEDREITLNDFDGTFIFFTVLGPFSTIMLIISTIVLWIESLKKKHGSKVLFKLPPKK